MTSPSLLQLQCLDALVSEGSFAAAAERLHRTHPSVHHAISTLEAQLGFPVLDRSGYRVTLTAAGQRFHAQSRLFLQHYQELRRQAAQLAAGEEAELRIVIGDLCPLQQTMTTLRPFFAEGAATRLNLDFESISGPWERLENKTCELAFHHLPNPAPHHETLHLFDVELVPVAAPGFLDEPSRQNPAPETLRAYTQCIIRDSGQTPTQNYHLIEGAHSVTVPDQLMKRALIVQGLAWGHMPLDLVQEDIQAGRLLNLRNPALPGARLPHYAIRRRDMAHGPVARRLWQTLQAQFNPDCR